ncbi:hypothetical protein P3T27_000344 [Kitasatospora sp. MAA19]|uniref:hypothetical protein n=1 Tax=Kitasatospora sp. MAA19 TaxID=3035090 RepID=UPI00247568D2|nr:hypothetical protein [Kitasatospora sp. MAA19]MDH6703663.1 hypothetical protein [Kitasatospora sp. MAA19]
MTAHLSSPGTPGPAGAHPSVDELADLAEGLIESADAADALRRHLDGCAECRETTDALGEVQALLGAVETPPMPADVAARLDAALAAAATAPEAVQATRNTPAAGSRAITPAPPSRAVRAPSAPPARPTAPTGPGRPRPRRRRVALLLGAATALAAIALGGALLVRPADQGDRHPAAAAGAPTGTGAAHSARADQAAGAGPVFRDDDQLADQVQQLLAHAGATPGLRPTGPAKPSAAPPAEGRQELTTQASPPACQAPAEGTPLATDHGSYAGAPVEVLVYPAPGRPGFADVYLRSPDCGPVVLHRTVPTR